MDTVPARAREIAAAFGALPGVRAVVLAGSRTGGGAEPASDLDLYVYAEETPSVAERAVIAGPDAQHLALDNRFWELGDDWLDAPSGLMVDVMYRSPSWIEAELNRVLVRHQASTGYSTCLWHNVLHSAPLVDPDGWYGALQDRARQPYPEPLVQAIIAKNHPILRSTLSSYLQQIEAAIRRADAVSVQHRLTAFLASYFDILFALNRLPHPGEKRQVWHLQTRGTVLPEKVEHDLDAVLAIAPANAAGALVPRLHTLLDGLDALLARDVATQAATLADLPPGTETGAM